MTFLESFDLNFIQRGRWKYLVTGVENTLIITLVATTIGILVGFLVAIIRSTHDKPDV